MQTKGFQLGLCKVLRDGTAVGAKCTILASVSTHYWNHDPKYGGKIKAEMSFCMPNRTNCTLLVAGSRLPGMPSWTVRLQIRRLHGSPADVTGYLKINTLADVNLA
jgi:hypothetical protein